MASDLEKAQLMSVLARSKGNWGDKYDRTEHFKRCQEPSTRNRRHEFATFGMVLEHYQNSTRQLNCSLKTSGILKFQNLKEIIKELSKIGWVIVHLKRKFTGVSLNTQYKGEIIEFIEKEMPYLKGVIK